MMKKNVGITDSRIRYILGIVSLVVAVLGFIGIIKLGIIFSALIAAFGVMMLVTGKNKTCGIYSAFDIDTSEVTDNSSG